MEISSHYYGIYALCIACGIREDIAQKIAYASQFVDDAVTNTITFVSDYNDNLFPKTNRKSKVTNIATCHSYFRIKTFNYQAMIFNTSAFHFFPGNKGNTFTKKLLCRKNPAILNDLISETINEKPFIPEKLGMLLHIFADTFSHQGFSGLICKENDIMDLKTYQEMLIVYLMKFPLKKARNLIYPFIDKVVPAYGHGQAYHYPDIPFGKWEYYYDKSDDFSGDPEFSDNNNTLRYRQAFELIAAFLEKIKEKNIYNTAILKNKKRNINLVLNLLVTPMRNKRKIRRWKKLIKKLGVQYLVKYDKHFWFKEAFINYKKKIFKKRVINDAELKDNFKDSSWYAFIKAMKWYKVEFIKRLEQDGLRIPY